MVAEIPRDAPHPQQGGGKVPPSPTGLGKSPPSIHFTISIIQEGIGSH